MVTGIAVLGVLAGALSSFFRLDQNGTSTEPPAPPASGDTASGDTASGDAVLQALAAEVAALRRQVEILTERLTRAPASQAAGDLAPGEDTPGQSGEPR